MTKKRIAILVSLLVFVLIVVSVISSRTSSLKLTNLPKNAHITIAKKTYTAAQVSVGVALKPGSYDLTVSSPLTDKVSQKISVGFFVTTLPITTKTLSESAVLQKIGSQDIADNFIFASGKLLESNTWAVVEVNAKDGNSDGYSNIYKFSDGSWNLIASGTGFDVDTLRADGAPNSVVRYFTE